jgi:hypothetical protein
LWLEETLLHSTASRRNNDNLQPKLNSYFTYQTPDSAEKFTNKTKKGLGCDDIYRYSNLISCKQWSSYINNPFNSFVWQQYMQLISPFENTTSKKKQLETPYEISWMSLTSDVGPIKAH